MRNVNLARVTSLATVLGCGGAPPSPQVVPPSPQVVTSAEPSERTKRNANFPNLVAEADARRKMAHGLAAHREKRNLSQTMVAALMGTSASVVSKLEAGGDVKVSTLQRYCTAIGKKLPIAV